MTKVKFGNVFITSLFKEIEDNEFTKKGLEKAYDDFYELSKKTQKYLFYSMAQSKMRATLRAFKEKTSNINIHDMELGSHYKADVIGVENALNALSKLTVAKESLELSFEDVTDVILLQHKYSKEYKALYKFIVDTTETLSSFESDDNCIYKDMPHIVKYSVKNNLKFP